LRLFSNLPLEGEQLHVSITGESFVSRRATRSLVRRAGLWMVAILVLSAVDRAEAGEGNRAKGAEITFGMSTVLSGPAADLGINMRDGVLAALEEANRGGGIHGCMLRLRSLDDSYEPAKTVSNMRALISDSQVVAVIGNVGTPTAVAALPIAMQAKMPFYGAFTGAGALRKNPPDRYVFNYRASYLEETAAMVDALLEYGKLKPEEIAFFTQRDAYGDAGFSGGIAALKAHGLQNVDRITHVRYERNTLAVEKAVSDLVLLNTPPRAIIMVGAYAPCAAFIHLARQNDLKSIFLNVSFVGSEPLAKALGADGEGVIVTQTVPHYGSGQPVGRSYREALSQLDPKLSPTFGSMEGYISTRLLLAALAKKDGLVTRDSVIAALEHAGEIDLGLGIMLRLSDTVHQASHTVWPTVMRNGGVVPFQWQSLLQVGATRD
jgi:branched-chain amino acid transport system substrate-binding protein